MSNVLPGADARPHFLIMSVLAAAGLASAGDILGTGINSALSWKNYKRTAALNYDYWLKQQQYNSPASQMSRLASAGINPYLALGSVSAGNAESASAAGNGSVTPSDVGSSAISAAQQARALKQQHELNEATIRKTNSEAVLNEVNATSQAQRNAADIRKTLSEAGLNETQIDAILKKLPLELEGQKGQNWLMGVQSREGEANIDLKEEELKTQREHTGKAREEKLLVQAERRVQELTAEWLPRKMQKELSLMVAQASQALASAAASRSQAELNRVQAQQIKDLTEFIKNKYKAETGKIMEESRALQLANDLIENNWDWANYKYRSEAFMSGQATESFDNKGSGSVTVNLPGKAGVTLSGSGGRAKSKSKTKVPFSAPKATGYKPFGLHR